MIEGDESRGEKKHKEPGAAAMMMKQVEEGCPLHACTL
jgi:hypothetical protein